MNRDKKLAAIQFLNKLKDNRKRDYNYIRELLECALSDIKVSKLSYSRDIFALAIFHLQQAIEKTTKAYSYNAGLVTRKEIKRHDPTIFQGLFKEKWLNYTKKITGNNLDIYPDSLNKFVTGSKMLSIMGEREFLDLKEGINNLKKGRDMPLHDLSFRYKRKRINLQEMGYIIKSAINFGISAYLFFYSWMHCQSTRYPDNTCGVKLAPADYNKDLLIVKNFDFFINEIQEASTQLLQYINQNYINNS